MDKEKKEIHLLETTAGTKRNKTLVTKELKNQNKVEIRMFVVGEANSNKYMFYPTSKMRKLSIRL